MPSQAISKKISCKKQQPFSKQRGGQHYRNMHAFKECLQKFSGGDPTSLLESYFQTLDGQKQLTLLKIHNNKLKHIVSQIKKYHNNAKSQEKKKWLSFLAPIYTRKELHEIGFQFSTNQFTEALVISSAKADELLAAEGNKKKRK
jgi:hypothetical protein